MALARGHRLDAYRCEGATRLIELRLREVRQLFNTLDPAPFHEKDLDSAAEEYIVSAVREIGAHPSRLVLHLPPGTTDGEACEAVAAIRHYFAHRSRHVCEQLRLLFVRGGISLLIGLAFLGSCLAARELLVGSSTPLDNILSEGLLILGWVAMWKPVEIFLYDWWPELGQRRLFERIAHMIIETQGVAPRRHRAQLDARVRLGERMTSAGNSLRLVKIAHTHLVGVPSHLNRNSQALNPLIATRKFGTGL